MPTKAMTKKEIDDFKIAAIKMLTLFGGVARPNDTFANNKFRVKLETIAGPLNCEVYDDWIAMCFEDEKRAKELITFGNLNPYSGKWNWMFTNATVQDVRELATMLAWVVAPPTGLFQQFNFAPAAFGKAMMLNTKLSYMYRDGDNFKVQADIVFPGICGVKQAYSLLALCDKSSGSPDFIPGMVGLRDLQNDFDSKQWDDERDHPFHEVTGLIATDEEVTADASFEHFQTVIKAMATVGVTTGWDPAFRPEFHEQMTKNFAVQQSGQTA